MPLPGSAAMLLSFDADREAVDEHDRWHTHAHLPERLSIPGFRRGTRWVGIRRVATAGAPRYRVLYEVASLQTLASASYLSGYDADALATWATELCAADALPDRAARELTRARCRFGYPLASAELDA